VIRIIDVHFQPVCVPGCRNINLETLEKSVRRRT
jgi:hypothetical protein